METDFESRAEILRTVVVGLDGSDASAAALEWIGNVIPPDGVVHAVHSAPPNDEVDSDAGDGEVDSHLSWWTRELRGRGVDVRLVPTGDPAVDALVHTARSADADAIVVGAHATGRYGPRLVGRTVRSLVNRSDRPVVVVPERASSAAGRDNTVVAGVGRGPATRAALHWATSFAVSRHTPLSLVRAVERRPFFDFDGLLDVMAYYIEPGTVHRWALADVAELADEIQRSTDEDLAIAWSAPPGAAGPRLIEATSDAALLVVGRRKPAAAGHHLPRYLEHTLKHAPCPIVIVPTDPSTDGGSDD